MFNRAPYNKTPYNRIFSVEYQWTSIVHGSAETVAHINLSMIFTAEKAIAEASVIGVCSIIVFPSSITEAQAIALAEYVRVIFFKALDNVEAVTEAKGTKVSIYELSTILIDEINMAAGDVLVIDTEQMSVFLNGVNIVDKLADDSVFFDLKPGLNQITVENIGTGSPKTDIKILWKDKWL